MNKEFVERLKRTFEGDTMADVARRLELPHATVRNYFNGRLPAPEVLIKIADETGVSLNWLLSGRGEMYAGDTAPMSLGRFIEEKISQMIDEKLDERFGNARTALTSSAVFSVREAIARLNDPQAIMQEWFTVEGREYPSDFDVVFFRGWAGFTDDQKYAAIMDAKRAIDHSLSAE
ncbi:MAG: helix-turn-helix domain-containing protein [Acidobacteriota bacterium]|nr:MAG: helix-turn-helix domain-containing protein [Acidobacteriota bacterium]